MKLTIVAELSNGGIADYAHDQSEALASRGIEVEVLCSVPFSQGRKATYKASPVLRELRHGLGQGNRFLRRVRLARGLLHNARVVEAHIATTKPDAVLTHFSEYLAPFWAPGMRRLQDQGISFHSVLHDPVRDHAVGPDWWHSWSVAEAFSFLETAFVHTREPLELPNHVTACFVPYGIHGFPVPQKSRAQIREEIGVPETGKMLTAFGYIRDNKNIDLVIRAIATMPDIHLVVAGSEQHGGNRPVSYYRELANKLACSDRVHWITRFVSDQETADLLASSDLSVLTYSRSFVSSSAALGVAANYRLPSLTSSGLPSMADMVREYSIGIWVEPDSVDAIRAGLVEWMSQGIAPRWDEYRRDYNWDRNAQLVEQRIRQCLTSVIRKEDIE